MNGRGRDSIFFKFAVEGVAADAQAPGGLPFVPAAIIQDFFEKFGLVIFNCNCFHCIRHFYLGL